MPIKNLLIYSLFFSFFYGAAQTDSLLVEKKEKQHLYNYNFKYELPITAVAAGVTLFNFTKIYSKDRVPDERVMRIDRNDVNRFDRGAAGNFDEDAEKISDMIFYGSVPVPLLVFGLDPKIRKDYLRVSLLYLQAMSFTGVVYSTSHQLNDRRRPYVYNTELDISERTRGASQNSFIAGHPALVGTATFFMAKVYADYHPDSAFKWVMYGLAGASTYATAHLRVKAGQHFPTDAIVGSVVGAASGFLVPYFHKNKLFKDPNLGLMPITGEYHGLSLSYTF
ncbi:phosphatase PAP2 family protein [Aquimarina intermedia]|uniref:PAP2 superfamily protein n=1 Tax=Aquimarina intermedia TaxID=350814 RepID=A0A5S5CD21_9FLAO|nr:phosphatase PAP2 family protein [Aquimarina intermedia]TYP77049.1 PAP2 superfamily protein [Aquimarina intermedia]